jgi:hypothetical protein
MLKVIEPEQPIDIKDEAEYYLIESNVPKEYAKWLAEIVTHAKFLPKVYEKVSDSDDLNQLPNEIEQVIDFISDEFRKSERESEVALIFFIYDLLVENRWGEKYKPIVWVNENELNEWVAIIFKNMNRFNWKKGIIDFLKERNWNYHHKHFKHFLSLLDYGAQTWSGLDQTIFVDILEGVDVQILAEMGSSPRGQQDGFSNPERLEYWLMYNPTEMLELFLIVLTHVDVSEIGLIIIGTYRAFLDTMMKQRRKLDNAESNNLMHQTQIAFYNYVLLIEDRLKIDSENRSLLKALWLYSKKQHDFLFEGFSAVGPELSKSQVKRFNNIASQELGKLRTHIKHWIETRTENEFDPEYYNCLVYYLSYYKSHWVVIKHLLVTFSSLTTLAVANDLRYWDERHKDRVPQPWSWIPNYIVYMLRYFIRSQPDKVAYKKLIEEFAQFCLTRIKTPKKVTIPEGDKLRNADFVDDRPIWRLCYIRALRELKINPKGKSHLVLKWVSVYDPNEEICAAAKTVYKTMRHENATPGAQHPAISFMMAFFWIKQAHFLALDIPDQEKLKEYSRGMQRTRTKEIDILKKQFLNL